MNVTEEWRRLTCSECGIVYFFPEAWCDRASEKGKSWQCPNGHGQHFTGATMDSMRRERDRLKQENARLEEVAAFARLAAEKAQLETKRIKKRAAAGTCPCCQRTFHNMSEHMKKEHPAFGAGIGANVIQLKATT